MASASLNVMLALSCVGTAQGFLLGGCPAGRRRQHQQQQQPSRHRLSDRSLGLLPLGATSGSSSSGSSSSGSSSDGKLTGFGSRARRRTKAGVANKRIKPGEDGGKRGGGVAAAPVVVLKRSNRWACVKNCGACCYLAPDERPDLAEYLPDPKELELYMSMANEDGWCKHFDKKDRACTIYKDRPRFCRVETETFGSMYGVDPEDMDDFCSACCHEQIGDVYGSESKEMRVFNEALAALERGERPKPDLSAFGGDLRGQGEAQIRDWGLDETGMAE
eukprot:g9993.t2